MSLKGKFEWTASSRKGGMRIISFVLTNDNFFGSETFNAGIVNSLTGQLGMQFANIKLDKGRSLRFDYDTVDWDWCQGDTFVTLDGKGRVKEQWPLRIAGMRPGECPECHGTHRCSACGGAGMLRNTTHLGGYDRCARCFGTGVCQTCYVPVRNPGAPHPDPLNPVDHTAQDQARQRKIAALRQRIAELEAEVQKTEWDVRMYQLKDMDVANKTAYFSVLQLKTNLSMQLAKLRHDLSTLENMQ